MVDDGGAQTKRLGESQPPDANTAHDLKVETEVALGTSVEAASEEAAPDGSAAIEAPQGSREVAPPIEPRHKRKRQDKEAASILISTLDLVREPSALKTSKEELTSVAPRRRICKKTKALPAGRTPDALAMVQSLPTDVEVPGAMRSETCCLPGLNIGSLERFVVG